MNGSLLPAYIVSHTASLVRSFKKWTGRELLSGKLSPKEMAGLLFEAPFVVVSHGTETDPVLNYGNQAALTLWEMSWEEFTRTPSRLTAEAAKREDRARAMDLVMRNGFIENYSGIRISKSGRRFEILGATIWNLISENGKLTGQAAAFSEWKFL